MEGNIMILDKEESGKVAYNYPKFKTENQSIKIKKRKKCNNQWRVQFYHSSPRTVAHGDNFVLDQPSPSFNAFALFFHVYCISRLLWSIKLFTLCHLFIHLLFLYIFNLRLHSYCSSADFFNSSVFQCMLSRKSFLHSFVSVHSSEHKWDFVNVRRKK